MPRCDETTQRYFTCRNVTPPRCTTSPSGQNQISHPAVVGASAPFDAFPVETEALVLETDVVERGAADEVAGLAAVPDLPFLGVVPLVPPESRLRVSAAEPPADERLAERRKIASSSLDLAIKSVKPGDGEHRALAANEQCVQCVHGTRLVEDIWVTDEHEVATRGPDSLIVAGREAEIARVFDHAHPRQLLPHAIHAAVRRGVVDEDRLPRSRRRMLGQRAQAFQHRVTAVPVHDDRADRGVLCLRHPHPPPLAPARRRQR